MPGRHSNLERSIETVDSCQPATDYVSSLDRFPDRLNRWAFRLFVVGVVLAGLAPEFCSAQFAIIAPAVDASAEDTSSQPGTGFDLGIDESLQTVVEDFQRFARRGLWEKAIETLEKVDQEKLKTGLLASDDGTILPAGEQLWRLQAGLSGEFREAFRVFLNAKARKLFAEATAERVKPQDREAKLNEVYATYFVSAVGDDATNLLGDNAFRNGKLDDAMRYWQSVIDYHPDSEIAESRLVFKIGVAAVQARDRQRFAESLRILKERFPQARTTFAGDEVSVVETLEKLASSASFPKSGDVGMSDGGASGLPEATAPSQMEVVWRHQLTDEKQRASLASSEQGYYRYKGIANWIVPTAIADGKLAYNFFGSTNCIDLETGKLLWRQEDPSTILDQLTGNIYQFSVDMYGIGAGDGVVLSRFIPAQEMNYYRAGADLVAYSLDSGKKLWDVDLEKRGQSEWFHVGTPFIETKQVGENTETTSYVVAIKSAGSDPHLRIHKNGSKPVAEIRLGRYRDIDVQDYNDKRIPLPVILGWSDNGHLLVAVDEGALLAVDIDEKRIAWAYRFEAPATGPNQYQSNQVTAASTLHPRTSAVRVGNTVYLKDSRRSLLVSYNIAKRKPDWVRQIQSASQVVAIDETSVFVLGEELLALDRETGGLVWAARLPMQNSGLSAEILGEAIVVFTGRGLYELNRHDGSVIRIHREVDSESNGGKVLRFGDKLITVSERAISAWQLASADADSTPDKSPSGPTEE